MNYEPYEPAKGLSQWSNAQHQRFTHLDQPTQSDARCASHPVDQGAKLDPTAPVKICFEPTHFLMSSGAASARTRYLPSRQCTALPALTASSIRRLAVDSVIPLSMHARFQSL